MARADPGGMAYFDTSLDGFWRSFYAAAFVAPLFVLYLVVRFHMAEIEVSAFRFASVEIIAYVIAWVIFPLMMFYICNSISRESQYISYIVAYNWASVWQNLVYLPFAMLTEFGMLPPGATRALGIAILIMVMLYTWFITKTALNISVVLAIGLVVLDFIVSIFINSLSLGMLK
ncbi:MAG: hypothetical protein HQ503_04725 [Rhodospirillales bacterium]|nr:hypothetical protein [Rhodospirillales bacterium]